MRKLRFGVGLEELGRVVSLIDTVVHDRWVRDVPIVPGDPKHLEQWREPALEPPAVARGLPYRVTHPPLSHDCESRTRTQLFRPSSERCETDSSPLNILAPGGAEQGLTPPVAQEE